MTYPLAVLFAASLVIPIAASAQMDLPNAQAQEPAPAILALTTSSRAGISPHVITNDRSRADLASTAKRSTAGTRGDNAVVGGLVGMFTGAAIGAAIGTYVDSQSHDAWMIPGFAIGGVFGAAGGLILGLLVGAMRPVS